MKAIHYNRQIVAFVHEGEIRLEPGIAALAVDHPRRRWIAGLAIFACEVECGRDPGPYCSARASAHARALLLPAPRFAALSCLPNAALARHFAVPGEQVAARRAELGLVWN
jgi:hypothetical protein